MSLCGSFHFSFPVENQQENWGGGGSGLPLDSNALGFGAVVPVSPKRKLFNFHETSKGEPPSGRRILKIALFYKKAAFSVNITHQKGGGPPTKDEPPLLQSRLLKTHRPIHPGRPGGDISPRAQHAVRPGHAERPQARRLQLNPRQHQATVVDPRYGR